MLRTRWPVVLFVLWSTYVWITRIVNALGDETANKPFAVALSLSVLAPVLASGVVLVRARHRGLGETEARLWQAAGVWTALVWLVRGAEIVVSDHGVAFKAVHVVVGAVSIALAAATVRQARRELVSAGGSGHGSGGGSGGGDPSSSGGVSPGVGVGR
jgi:hypothetical protein